MKLQSVTRLLSLWLVAIFISACASNQPLETVNDVSLERYQGVWYDIAHLPQRFQDDCKCVTAEYTLKEDFVEVLNTCHDKETGEVSSITGKAFSIDPDELGKLEVEFFWPFKGDYYILKLDSEYRYVLVGSPDRESLWVLSREAQAPAIVLKQYLNYAEDLGFNTSDMVFTDQSCSLDTTK